MANKLNFTLVSPERELFSGEVDMVVAPGEMGDFGVLAGHAPFMTTLRSGAIAIREGGSVRRMFVHGGFADVTPEGLTILAEQAVPVDDIDLEQIRTALRDAQEDVSDATSDETRRVAEAQVSRLEAMIAAVDDDFYAKA